jgi:hypothetical protein
MATLLTRFLASPGRIHASGCRILATRSIFDASVQLSPAGPQFFPGFCAIPAPALAAGAQISDTAMQARLFEEQDLVSWHPEKCHETRSREIPKRLRPPAWTADSLGHARVITVSQVQRLLRARGAGHGGDAPHQCGCVVGWVGLFGILLRDEMKKSNPYFTG